jgi:hypothetical protein
MNTLLRQIPNTDRDSLKNLIEKVQEKIAGLYIVEVHSIQSYISNWPKTPVFELDVINAGHLEKLIAVLQEKVTSLGLPIGSKTYNYIGLWRTVPDIEGRTPQIHQLSLPLINAKELSPL